MEQVCDKKFFRMMRARWWESPSLRKKAERIIISACIGAMGGCVLAWIIFFPVL